MPERPASAVQSKSLARTERAPPPLDSERQLLPQVLAEQQLSVAPSMSRGDNLKSVAVSSRGAPVSPAIHLLGRHWDVQRRLGVWQGDLELAVAFATKFLSQRCEFFAADSSVGIDEFTPGEATDRRRHQSGRPLKMRDGIPVIVDLLECDTVKQLAGSFENASVVDLVQLGERLLGHAKVEESVSRQKATDSFRGHLNSHRTGSIMFETGSQPDCCRTDLNQFATVAPNLDALGKFHAK